MELCRKTPNTLSQWNVLHIKLITLEQPWNVKMCYASASLFACILTWYSGNVETFKFGNIKTRH